MVQATKVHWRPQIASPVGWSIALRPVALPGGATEAQQRFKLAPWLFLKRSAALQEGTAPIPYTMKDTRAGEQ